MNVDVPCFCAPASAVMINEIDIRNYKCFEHLHISNCRQVNVIVGDNGAGKTALLEAVFMALGSTSDFVLRFRQFRGLDGSFRAPARKVEEAIWRDYFYKMDMSRSISITLSGSGTEVRSVRMDRGQGELLIPLEDKSPSIANSSIRFHWKDHTGNEHIAIPEITGNGIKFPETGEDLPDFFFMVSNQTFSSAENADRFSDLTKDGRRKLIDIFTREYNWIEDLSVESKVGAPAIYGKIKGLDDRIPITSISGGINRFITLLLMIASRDKSIVLVDEVENGLYYSHHKAYWRSILSYAHEYNSQLFLTTHSEEWLQAFADVVDSRRDDVALWRAEQKSGAAIIRQFVGRQAALGIRAGEIR